MDPALHDLTVSQQTRLDASGNPYSVHIYTYYLGKNGPFRFELPWDQAQQGVVQAKIDEQAAQLRNIGALPGTGY